MCCGGAALDMLGRDGVEGDVRSWATRGDELSLLSSDPVSPSSSEVDSNSLLDS